jgi:hypothetical protein
MTPQKLSKYAMITAGLFYILFGLFAVGICLHVCFTDDRPKAIVMSAILSLMGLGFVCLGIKRIYEARRAA